MIRRFTGPYSWAVLFTFLLIFSFTYVLLDTFVIQKSLTKVEDNSPKWAQSESKTEAVVTDRSYEDDWIKITIDTEQKYNSILYIADIWVSDPKYLKTALANNTYGRNIKDKTSNIAEENHAIFAINGDYYGFREEGYVLRNGEVYRETARSDKSDEDLVIDENGDFSIIHENQVSINTLLNDDNIWQILSFGPSLVENGQLTVNETSEVSRAKTSNPRTAIGQISEGHYIIIVSDGRTEESAGISLLELAQELKERGCITAYNLDGGGSSTMYFNGKVMNHPTDGRSMKEREVSDIVYIGY
ncbi:phosphodiester glycosidase family protein [Clostridium aminobutyricum]|uniref:Phosphodiester glycosidase family protein n=1 Tax=Clostridium aminobutyricum TaxID=33953 RepID=A0A939D6N8_CLOAM|nr:phosphodiester glycosidase family protein [Clostridium aminobutyricum]MBN7772509.1 phosphodiester glycosidase family protein [Clostridium aminobutyricum]